MGIDDWQERHCLCPSTLLHHYLEVSIVIARSRSNDPSAAQGDSICDVLITPGQISMTGSREACGAVPATSSRRTSACPHGRFPWLSLVCNQPLRLTSSWTAIYRLLQRIASLVGRPSLHLFHSGGSQKASSGRPDSTSSSCNSAPRPKAHLDPADYLVEDQAIVGISLAARGSRATYCCFLAVAASRASVPLTEVPASQPFRLDRHPFGLLTVRSISVTVQSCTQIQPGSSVLARRPMAYHGGSGVPTCR